MARVFFPCGEHVPRQATPNQFLTRDLRPLTHSEAECDRILCNFPPEGCMAAIRFGSFEVDPRSGELRCDGKKVRLQEQPFQVLVSLLERPGEIVTREELTKRLWPGETYVDFERGLNKAVTRLRDALGDSAVKPHYIETLPRRGYRFIATVHVDAPVVAPEV